MQRFEAFSIDGVDAVYGGPTCTCSSQAFEEHDERHRLFILALMFSPSNLFKARSRRYIYVEIISMCDNAHLLLQVKIRMVALRFVTRTTMTEKTNRVIEEG